jgi:hypothetical protein
MKLLVFKWIAVFAAFTSTVFGQQPVSKDKENGFTEVETFQGAVGSSERLFKLDSTLGYDFNKHFGVYAGIPVYFTNFSSTSSTARAGTNLGLGNAYLGFVVRSPHKLWNFASFVTAAAPTGSVSKGYSSGRASMDWSNRLEGALLRLKPFVTAGLSNTVPDSALITRPFTSLGVVGHLEEGSTFTLVHHFSIGASFYQILPSGNQKVFSKVVPASSRGVASAGAGHGPHSPPVFKTSPVASGAGLTRENGVGAWIDFEPNPFWRAEIGYSRSVTYDLNSLNFTLGLNIGRLLRSKNSR